MNQILRCNCLPRGQDKAIYLDRSGLPAESPRKKSSRKPCNKSFVDQACSVKMAGYGSRSFLRVYGSRVRLGP